MRPIALVAVKVVHTVVWAFFAGCILAIPVASWFGHHAAAAWLTGIVLVEVAILVVNGWRCPLTSLASRYTDERQDNFDIYLPPWLARHNKLIFGVLFCLGVVFAYFNWPSGEAGNDSSSVSAPERM
jgi:polyferredoxin